MALVVGVSSVECPACVGRMCTRSREGAAGNGLLRAWAVALGSNFVGSGLRISFWGSSTTSFPLPFSVSNGRLLHFDVYNAPPLWCQLGTLPLDSLPLDEHAADW